MIWRSRGWKLIGITEVYDRTFRPHWRNVCARV